MIILTEHKNYFKALTYMAGLLLFSHSYAAKDELSDEDFFDEIPTVLTVSRLKQPKSEAPSSVTVINRDMIKAAGIRELADVFRLVPGFIVGYERGNNPVVTYQGMGYVFNRQLQVLVDGRSVYIPSFGGIPWVHLPVILEDIEKIEITRGPNAASYGSNSFLAVINIITSEASQDEGINLSVSQSNDHKNVSDAYFSISRIYDTFDWRISAKTLSDDGFEAFDATYPNHDGKKLNKFNFRSNFLITQNSQWSFQLGVSDDKTEIGDGQPLDIFREESTLNKFQTLAYEQSTDNSSTSIKFFHTTHSVDDSFDTPYPIAIDPSATATVGYDRFSERSEIEIQHSLDLSSQLRVVFGGSYRKDTVDSFFLLGKDNKQSLNVTRLLSHTEYKFTPDQILNIGAMIEKSDVADVSISPRIAFIQHLDNKSTMRLAYSKAYRNPILFELYSKWAFQIHLSDASLLPQIPVGSDILETFSENPDLKPEEIESFELGFNSRLTPYLESDLKIYQTDISNQVLTARDPNSPSKFQFQNLTSTQTTGIELSIKYTPSKKMLLHSGVTLSSTESPDEDAIKSFPTRTAFILSRYDINKRHSISGAYYFLGKLKWIDFNIEPQDIKKLDLRYAYNIELQNKNPITLEIIGQNLLGNYADYRDSNIQSKAYFLTISSRF